MPYKVTFTGFRDKMQMFFGEVISEPTTVGIMEKIISNRGKNLNKSIGNRKALKVIREWQVVLCC